MSLTTSHVTRITEGESFRVPGENCDIESDKKQTFFPHDVALLVGACVASDDDVGGKQAHVIFRSVLDCLFN